MRLNFVCKCCGAQFGYKEMPVLLKAQNICVKCPNCDYVSVLIDLFVLEKLIEEFPRLRGISDFFVEDKDD